MEQADTTRRFSLLTDALPGAARGVPKRVRDAAFALLALVAAIQLTGLGFVLYDSYRLHPALRAVGITTEFDDDAQPVVRPLRADIVAAGVGFGDRIVSVGARRFGPRASALSLGRAVLAAPGPSVAIGFRKPDGRELRVRASRTSRAAIVVLPNPIPIGVRLAVRLAFTALCTLSLLGSAFVLLHRRPRDPEALLIALGFLGIAAAVDPALILWMSIGSDWVIDVVTGLWWSVLVVALAAFPDGRFTPRWLRWSLVAAPLLGLLLAIDRLSDAVSILLGVCVPLTLLAAQVIRYRRVASELARQQIKWAALGFSLGFVLVGAALAMSLAGYDAWTPGIRGAWLLATVCLFELGFAIMPLGLLVSILRYRLWDVDQIISRSVAVTLLSGGIGLLWALLSDVAKQAVASLLGPDHAVIGIALGAVVAVGVFVPTQQIVLRWSKRRFNPAGVALERLPERLRLWRERCDATELATRALDVAMRALHPSAGAIFARTATGRALLASRRADGDESAPPSAADGGVVLHLEDEDGLAGWLILAPRADGSRFPRAEVATLRAAARPLATALRTATPADRREAAVLTLLDEVQRRLAQLEQQGPRPAGA